MLAITMDTFRRVRRVVDEVEEWDFFTPGYRHDRFPVSDCGFAKGGNAFLAARELGRTVWYGPGALAGRSEDRDAAGVQHFCDAFAMAYLLPRGAVLALARRQYREALLDELVRCSGVPIEHVLARLQWVRPFPLEESSCFMGIFSWGACNNCRLEWRLDQNGYFAPGWMRTLDFPYRRYGCELSTFGFFANPGWGLSSDLSLPASLIPHELHAVVGRKPLLRSKDGRPLFWSNLIIRSIERDAMGRRMLLTAWLHSD